MSSSHPRSNSVVHQDYIARIRYSNALPPPPNPPKLLEIPNPALGGGLYTTPGFASRLAREHPLNIEADAELGMPLDLVGMPGVFEEGKSSIEAPAHKIEPHPRDRPLLRSVAQLGKPQINNTSVAFLRRTEFTSSGTAKPIRPRGGTDIFMKKPTIMPNLNNKRKIEAEAEADKGSPAYIKRRIERSFEAASRALADKSRLRHPIASKRNLRCVDAAPLLPDLDAFPDTGAYVTIKFQQNPMTAGGGSGQVPYDTRLLAGLFKPREREVAEEAAFDLAFRAYERDPENSPRPVNVMSYDFFLARDQDTASRFRKRFDVDNPDNDSPDLYNCVTASNAPSAERKSEAGSGAGCFRFPHIRSYETIKEKEMDHETKWEDEVILAVRNKADDKSKPETARPEHDRVVYYYPVMQRSTIRAVRATDRRLAEEGHWDELNVRVDEPDESLRKFLELNGANPYGLSEDQLPQSGERESGNANGEEVAPAPETRIGDGAAAAETKGDEDPDAEGDDD